jgi:PIN domain nuclease of toxin-antitoxin system
MPRAEVIVLDTHVWVDIAMGRGRFQSHLMRKIDASADEGSLYVAAITPWEVAMLARKGKLRVTQPLGEWLNSTLRETRTAVAPLNVVISVDAVELPAWSHGDPADRLIVATTRFLSGLLVTRDTAIIDYASSVKAVRVLEPT